MSKKQLKNRLDISEPVKAVMYYRSIPATFLPQWQHQSVSFETKTHHFEEPNAILLFLKYMHFESILRRPPTTIVQNDFLLNLKWWVMVQYQRKLLRLKASSMSDIIKL